MRNEQHYRRMLEQNQNASIGFTLAAAMVYAARYGMCDPEHHGTDEFKTIARRLKTEYGENLTVGECSAEMDKAGRSAAAAKLGSIKSKRKAQSSRENAQLGGRPAGSKNKPKGDDEN